MLSHAFGGAFSGFYLYYLLSCRIVLNEENAQLKYNQIHQELMKTGASSTTPTVLSSIPVMSAHAMSNVSLCKHQWNKFIDSFINKLLIQ